MSGGEPIAQYATHTLHIQPYDTQELLETYTRQVEFWAEKNIRLSQESNAWYADSLIQDRVVHAANAAECAAMLMHHYAQDTNDTGSHVSWAALYARWLQRSEL